MSVLTWYRTRASYTRMDMECCRSTTHCWTMNAFAHNMCLPQCETVITCLDTHILLSSHHSQHPGQYTVADMFTTILLALFTTVARASLTPLLPPIVVRDGLHNSTIHANISAAHNETYTGAESIRNYDTAAYKVYIAFLVFGTVSATLMLPVIYSPNAIHWWRQSKHQKALKQRKGDVAEATARVREMRESIPPPPPDAYLRPERAVRPGSNWV
jgi:hypothetical protein